MKSLRKSGLIILCLGLALSCKKKNHGTETEEPEPATPNTVVYDNYSGLSVGNYWVYGRYQVDADGTVTNLNQYDSCYVGKDTTIRNQKYYQLVKYDFLYDKLNRAFLRDSLQYIVSSDGSVLFSYSDFNTVFKTVYNTIKLNDSTATDTICRISLKMDDKDLVVNLPAGTFTTSSLKSTYSFYPNWVRNGLAKRYRNNRYAKNIGLVLETEPFYLSANSVNERRLVRYHLNQ